MNNIYHSNGKIVGLTGGIACGKSTVAKTFIANNIPVVDADQVARDVVKPGTLGHTQIMETFGNSYFQDDGYLNRAKLASLVFSDTTAMSKLNKIMTPLIAGESTYQLGLHTRDRSIVVYDAALICEIGNAEKYRPLIVVHCPQDTQIDRLMRRNGLTYEQAMSRIMAQMPVAEKIAMADFTIDTSGTIEESVQQTEIIIVKLMEKMQ